MPTGCAVRHHRCPVASLNCAGVIDGPHGGVWTRFGVAAKLHNRQVSLGKRPPVGRLAARRRVGPRRRGSAVLRPRHTAESDRALGIRRPSRGTSIRVGFDRALARSQLGPVGLARSKRVSSRSVTHLVAETNPYNPAPQAVPDSRVRRAAAPFMPIASIASRPSVRASTGVPAVKPSADVERTMSASG